MTNSVNDISTGKRWLIAVVTLVVFWFADTYAGWLYKQFAPYEGRAEQISAWVFLRYGLWWAPPILLAAIFFGWRKSLAALGLNGNILTAFTFGLAGTGVLLIGFFLTANFSPPAPGDYKTFDYQIIRGAVLAASMEELFYRAFLFGFLFRFAGWGFAPAALIGAAFFGVGHLYQGDNAMQALAIFAITGLGAVWFAWLYVEWRYNLWVPIAFHLLMNLYWSLFNVSETALGSTTANVLRFVVILLSIVGTVIYARYRGGRIIKGRTWIWRGHSNLSDAPV